MNPALRFIFDLHYDNLPDSVIRQAQRCLLDLIGTAAGGFTTDTSRLIRNHAARHFGAGAGPGARLLFDGRRVSPGGAALAGGMIIDSLDCHDGHVLTKGHAGVAILPSLLALMDAEGGVSDHEFLTALVLGYEIATRAGIAQHATCCDYHSSGAWGATACAALAARWLGLNAEQTRQAAGIAEYHGPRSQIMRVVDSPTMVKDGAGWGAMTGLSAAYLAADGFTGAPALTWETDEVANIWADVGSRWRILEQYFKAYPVCRWAQPAIEAALTLQREHNLAADAIARVEVVTFHEGTRLATRTPASSDEAQYSLPFSVAAALTCGQVGAAEVSGAALHDPAILRLSEAIILTEGDDYNAKFPAERWAHVVFHLAEGSVLTSASMEARGSDTNPLSDDELCAKYWLLAEPVLGTLRTQQIETCVARLVEPEQSLMELRELLAQPVMEIQNDI